MNITYKSHLKNIDKSNNLVYYNRARLRNRYNIDFAYLPAAILARFQCNATRLSAWQDYPRGISWKRQNPSVNDFSLRNAGNENSPRFSTIEEVYSEKVRQKRIMKIVCKISV